jgi:hypothetical protein
MSDFMLTKHGLMLELIPESDSTCGESAKKIWFFSQGKEVK